jgi:hypothetical protein
MKITATLKNEVKFGNNENTNAWDSGERKFDGVRRNQLALFRRPDKMPNRPGCGV